MKTEDFAYIVETEKSFDEAVVSVLKSVDKKGWSLFNVYDVKERLSVKGFEQKPLKIIGMKPTMISQFFPEVSKKEAEEAEKDIKEIVDNAK